MEEKNIFTDLRDLFKGAKKGIGQLSGSSEDEQYVKTAHFDNPNQIYDNLLRYFKFIILLAVCASMFFGVSYHYKAFLKTGNDSDTSLGLSLLLFLIAEAISVFVGIEFFRYAWMGKIIKSLSHFVFFVVMGFMIYMAFTFRLDISSKAYGGQNENDKKTETSKGIVAKTLQNQVSSYDSQIAEAQSTIARGKKQTWEGKLTKRGEYLVGEGNKTLQYYLMMKNNEIQAKAKSESDLNGLVFKGIEANSRQLNTYGGLVEWSILLLTFLYALLEKLSYVENKKLKEDKKSDEIENTENPKQNAAPISFQKPTQNYSNDNRPTINGRQQMGFFKDNLSLQESSKQNLPEITNQDIQKKNDESELIIKSKIALYQKGIKSLNLLLEMSNDIEKNALYEKGIKSLNLLIKMYI